MAESGPLRTADARRSGSTRHQRHRRTRRHPRRYVPTPLLPTATTTTATPIVSSGDLRPVNSKNDGYTVQNVSQDLSRYADVRPNFEGALKSVG